MKIANCYMMIYVSILAVRATEQDFTKSATIEIRNLKARMSTEISFPSFPVSVIIPECPTKVKHKILLREFEARLKSSINNSFFDTFSFTNQAQELESELLVLSKVCKTISSTEVFVELMFLHNLLAVMMEASQLMGCYQMMEVPGHDIVYKAIELKVMVLSLFDIYGHLDVSVHEYEKRLARLTERLEFWESQLDSFVDVPRFMSFTFENQISQTRRMLNLLNGEISKAKSVGK